MANPARQSRIAAIEQIVAEYTGLLSAAHFALFGAAPWRAHAETAFHLHYRNLDDFLLGASEADHIVAVHYLPDDAPRAWDLPLWRADWRDHTRQRLQHLDLLQPPDPAWTPHRCIPKLELEMREAWKQFYAALTDDEYRRAFVHQVEVKRRELVPFHVRVELLYV